MKYSILIKEFCEDKEIVEKVVMNLGIILPTFKVEILEGEIIAIQTKMDTLEKP